MKEGIPEVPRASTKFEEREEEVAIPGAVIDTIDITPEELHGDLPVLVSPAWGGTIPAYRETLETLAVQGVRVLSLNQPRHGGELPESGSLPDSIKHYPKEQLRKAQTLLGLLNAKRVDRVDVIAHSEGAVNAALAARMAPEKFRTLVLYGPGGLIGEDTPQRLAKSFIKDSMTADKPSLRAMPAAAVSDEEAADGWEAISYPKLDSAPFKPVALTEAAKYIGGNPVRSFKEVYGLSEVQMQDLIAELSALGVSVIIMSAVDDPVYPTQQIGKMLKQGSVRGFLSVRGGHGEIVNNPRYMVAAAHMLAAESERQKKATAASEEQRSTPPQAF